MLDIYPDYYGGFACLAGACPDTCCAQWEVVVDDDTAALYNSVPGTLGERLRGAMTIDEDGDRIIRHVNGCCPLLSGEGLCGIQLALGHEALCRVCREFPRLCQDYTIFREHSLSLACPEGARRILTAPALPVLEVRGEAETAELEYDQQDMDLLQAVRTQMFQILADGSRAVSERLALCLCLGEQAQGEIDGDSPAPFSEREALARFHGRQSPADWRGVLEFYAGLDILTPAWKALLDNALAHPLPPEQRSARDPFLAYPQEFCNLFFDGLYRTLFCAVADFDLLPRVKAAALSCALSRYLIALNGGEGRLRIHQLYAKEVEHCAENKDALLDACCMEPFFTTEGIFSLLL